MEKQRDRHCVESKRQWEGGIREAGGGISLRAHEAGIVPLPIGYLQFRNRGSAHM